MYVTDLHACKSSPCEHNGQCHDTLEGFLCSCNENYEGPTCSGRYWAIPVHVCYSCYINSVHMRVHALLRMHLHLFTIVYTLKYQLGIIVANDYSDYWERGNAECKDECKCRKLFLYLGTKFVYCFNAISMVLRKERGS